jgi:hypothetical protein
MTAAAPKSYRILVAVDEGDQRRKLLSIRRSSTGIYLATHDPGLRGAHVSYKQDGTLFSRAEGYPGPDPPPIQMVPLDAIRGFVVYPLWHIPLPRERVDRLPVLSADDDADVLVSVRRAEIGRALNCRVYLVEPDQEVRPFVPGRLLKECEIQVTNPWILVQACSPYEDRQ